VYVAWTHSDYPTVVGSNCWAPWAPRLPSWRRTGVFRRRRSDCGLRRGPQEPRLWRGRSHAVQIVRPLCIRRNPRAQVTGFTIRRATPYWERFRGPAGCHIDSCRRHGRSGDAWTRPLCRWVAETAPGSTLDRFSPLDPRWSRARSTSKVRSKWCSPGGRK